MGLDSANALADKMQTGAQLSEGSNAPAPAWWTLTPKADYQLSFQESAVVDPLGTVFSVPGITLHDCASGLGKGAPLLFSKPSPLDTSSSELLIHSKDTLESHSTSLVQLHFFPK